MPHMIAMPTTLESVNDDKIAFAIEVGAAHHVIVQRRVSEDIIHNALFALSASAIVSNAKSLQRKTHEPRHLTRTYKTNDRQLKNIKGVEHRA